MRGGEDKKDTWYGTYVARDIRLARSSISRYSFPIIIVITVKNVRDDARMILVTPRGSYNLLGELEGDFFKREPARLLGTDILVRSDEGAGLGRGCDAERPAGTRVARAPCVRSMRVTWESYPPWSRRGSLSRAKKGAARRKERAAESREGKKKGRGDRGRAGKVSCRDVSHDGINETSIPDT